MENGRKRTLKGSVAVRCKNDWLSLRWTWGGQRYEISLGLFDSRVNRTVAERKAKLIEQDMLTERFDPTLERYKPQIQTSEVVSAVELFEKFMTWKSKQVGEEDSMLKYTACLSYTRQYFRKLPATISEEQATQFRDWLAKKLAPITLRERISSLRSCWRWGMRRKLVAENPWQEVKVKVPPKQRLNPFTKEETQKILKGFSTDPWYTYYTDFVEFLMSTGCRIGEAVGLRWKHLSADCSEVWIGESFGRGKRKPTKTNKARWFDLSPRLKDMFLARKKTGSYRPDDLIFPARRGGAIDDKTFNKYAWKTILNQVGVPYRMPRSLRHSFVSNAAHQGLTPSEISDITGHSEETIFRHYLGSVRGRAKLPDLLKD